jgi:hypothetical protein
MRGWCILLISNSTGDFEMINLIDKQYILGNDRRNFGGKIGYEVVVSTYKIVENTYKCKQVTKYLGIDHETAVRVAKANSPCQLQHYRNLGGNVDAMVTWEEF